MTDDVEGVCVVSFPLPVDHWIYEPPGEPPAPLPVPASLQRDWMERALWAAGKYVVRGATGSGQDAGFDPDALIMNLVVGLLGHARPKAQLMGAEEPAPESVPRAPHSPKSGGGYPVTRKNPRWGWSRGTCHRKKAPSHECHLQR